MYCRNCGNEIFDNTIFCEKCGVKKGKGVNFCQTCGARTSLKMEYCLNCGISQKTIAIQQMDVHKISLLQSYARSRRKSMKNAKIAAIVSIAIALFLAILFVVRPQPDNIPQPNIANAQISEFGYDFYYNADYNVQSYWAESRKLLMYIFLCICVCIGSSIVYFLQKKKYIKLINIIKEAKNVL
jgi:hypothetical protein